MVVWLYCVTSKRESVVVRELFFCTCFPIQALAKTENKAINNLNYFCSPFLGALHWLHFSRHRASFPARECKFARIFFRFENRKKLNVEMGVEERSATTADDNNRR